MHLRIISTLFLLSVIVSACVPAAPSPTSTPTPAPTNTPTPAPSATLVPSPVRLVAYVTESVIPPTTSYDRLTHINYAFALPNTDGTLQPLANTWKIQQIVQVAHAHNVKVLISVGGWGWVAQFESLSATPETRATFVQGLQPLLVTYQFDGVDIDWEYPVTGKSDNNFMILISELHAALGNNKLLTAAATAYGKMATVF